MKLLLLTPQLPYPPHQGTTIRNYNLIRQLAVRHDVHLMSFVQGEDEAEAAGPLCELCRSVTLVIASQRTMAHRVKTLLASRLPDMALRLPSAEFRKRLEAFVNRQDPDVVQVEGIEMAQYGLAVADGRNGRRPLLVFDDHNAEYVLQRRAFETDVRRPRRWMGAAYSWVQWRRLMRYEALVCRRLDRVVVVSETDRVALRRIVPGLDMFVIPNGVDSDWYRPQPAGSGSVSAASRNLVFTGKMDFRPNVDAVLWFVHEILPLVRAEVPDVRFEIVGQKPHPRVRALSREPGVVVTGFVEDVRPHIAAAGVYVVPLRMGGGTRLKVMEAMAMGAALVSTSVGCEGFPLVSGQHLVVADTSPDFAAAVVSLLRDTAERQRLGREARRFVEAHCDWKSIVPMFERVYEG